MLNSKLWNQEKYELQWSEYPESRRIAQSKGKAKMVQLPKEGDAVSFVLKGKIVMKGIIESDGFVKGTAHREHSCNMGESRPHSEAGEFAWVKITEVGLSEPIAKTGQRTWIRKKN